MVLVTTAPASCELTMGEKNIFLPTRTAVVDVQIKKKRLVLSFPFLGDVHFNMIRNEFKARLPDVQFGPGCI